MDGVFRPLINLGGHIKVGDTLGVISAPFSSEETVLTAEFTGIIICVSHMPLVNQGDALFHIARFKSASIVEGEIAAHESQIEEDRLYDIETVPASELD
jgi:hypothetical protein